MKDEEEELQEAMAAALASGTAYYLDSTDNNNDSTMTDTLQALSLNSTTSTISAPPSSDPDAALDPDPAVRIIKPLPKRDLKSRFPAARVIKPLPRRLLKPRIIKPLLSLSDSAKALVVEGSATPSSLTDIPLSPLSSLISDHDMGGSENPNINNTVRVIDPLPRRMLEGCSLNNPTSEPSVAEANTTPSAYIPPSSPSSFISGSEDFILGTVRVMKPLPKRMMKDRSLNDPETQSTVVEVSTTPSPPTHIPLSNPTPTLTADQNAGLSNVVQIRTSTIAERLTTSLAPPLLPPPIRPIDNDIESFFATSSPHISKSLSNPMTGVSTSMDNLTVPFTSPAALVKPTSSMPSKFSSPVSFYTKNQSRVKLAQTSAAASEDDEDVNALIKRFTKSRVVWVDDIPDPIPAPQPTVPLQMRFATPIPPTHGCSARNMIVETCELNHSEEVGRFGNIFEQSFLM